MATLSMLDQFQQCVVAFPPDRNLVVSACAGSGKSSVLALRAKELVQRWGFSASQCLVLTFSTRSRADLMAKISRVFPSTAPIPEVQTYHAYALSILRKAGCRASVIQVSDARNLMKQVLTHLGKISEGNANAAQSRAAIRASLALVSRAKAGHDTAAHLSASEQEIIDTYTTGLKARGLISFDDMVPMAIEALSSGSGLITPYSHILLDEAQDTSESQLQLLRLLAPQSHTVVTAVGDADQTIYAFRGSRSDMLARITATFACMPLVLPTNYRCCARVVEVARAMIQASPLREELPLLSAPQAKLGEVRIIQRKCRSDELDAICHDIRRVSKAQPGKSIALLCRLRAHCTVLRRALKEYGIVCSKIHRSSGTAIDGEPTSASSYGKAGQNIVAWLRLVSDPYDDDAFLTVVSMPVRTGFANGESSVGVRYLRALARVKSTETKPVSLLMAAVHAARHRWPSVPSLSSQQSPRLNKSQEEALLKFLYDFDHLRSALLRAGGASTSMEHLLREHSQRIGLLDALVRERASLTSRKAAFKVKGLPRETNTSSSSASEDEVEGLGAHSRHRRVAQRQLESFLQAAASLSAAQDRRGASAQGRSGELAAAFQQKQASIATVLHPTNEHLATDRLDSIKSFTDSLILATYDGIDTPWAFGSNRTSETSTKTSNTPNVNAPDVVVMTIHQSKGLEWDCVYVCHTEDGSLPLLPKGLEPRTHEYIEQLEEERRLAYVAFTRARRQLVVTWSEGQSSCDGGNTMQRNVRSRFLSKLGLDDGIQGSME